MASEIKVDTIVNAGGDNDSGIDLGTNDTVKVTIAGAEKARFDSNGRLGIGTTSPDTQLVVANGSDTAKLNLDSDSIDFFTQGKTFNLGTTDNTVTRFFQNNSERMRIDTNGTLLVNDTGRALGCKAQITYTGASEQGLIFENTANSASGAAIRFVDSDGDFSGGGIYYTDSNSINYQTTSDYRLKENIVTDWDATTELKKLKPSKFNFKKTPSKTVQGFIAHEVSNVVPEAIIGEKDGTEKYIDDNDGKEKTREAYQTIDQSKLVPLLTKALQEAISEIDTLKAKVAALESK